MLLQDIPMAVLGGLAGTTLMTGMMLMGQRLGLPAIDVHGILGHISHPDRRTALGYVAHWVLGSCGERYWESFTGCLSGASLPLLRLFMLE
jgi:hypothetical protein